MESAVFVELERVARDALGSRAWSVDLVLRVGAELAQCVNKVKNVSGRQKADAVLQTIQRLLDDGEKAERALRGESTGTVTTKVPWEECKMVATELLPVTLDLLIDAARGRLDLKKVETVARVGCALAPWICCGKTATAAYQPEAPAAKAQAPAAKPQEVSLQYSNPLKQSEGQPPLAQDTQGVKDSSHELPKDSLTQSHEKGSSNVVSDQSSQ